MTAAGDAAGFEARVACEDVVRASFRLIDQGRASAAAELYAAGATLVMESTEQVRLRGEEIQQAMEQREKQDRRTVHVVSPSLFRIVDPALAACESHLQVYRLDGDRTGPPAPRTVSRVHDELIRDSDGHWRIAARRITVLAGGM